MNIKLPSFSFEYGSSQDETMELMQNQYPV
jgi:hypothetical protein